MEKELEKDYLQPEIEKIKKEDEEIKNELKEVYIATTYTKYTEGVRAYVFRNYFSFKPEIQDLQKFSDNFFKECKINENFKINLYLTDNPIYNLAVINSCIKYKCKLVCIHYIESLNMYISQTIID